MLLTADPRVVHARTPELDDEEIERQLTEWQAIGGSRAIPASEQGETQEAAIAAVNEHLAARVGDLSSFATALRALGAPAAGGVEHVVVRAGGRARWLLPSGGPGPLGSRLYRPPTTRHRCGAGVLGVVNRTRVPLLPLICLDTTLGLAPEIAALLGRRSVDLAALLPTDPWRSSRASLSVLDAGEVLAIAKVAPTGSTELETELRVLLALEPIDLRVLRPPRVHGWFSWQGLDVLVQEALPIEGCTDRALSRLDAAALAELAGLGERLADVLGGEGAVPAHGDFCAWNTARHGSRLATWDWEWAHAGAPLEDLFHWHTQRLVHFRRGSEDELLRMALSPSAAQREQYAATGASADDAPAGLAAALRHGLASLSVDAAGRERAVRETLLAWLEGRS
jgi:hypothetical protein